MKKPDINVLKSGLYSAAFTFVGLFLPAAVGWLNSFAGWLSTSHHTPLPGISTLGHAAIAAFGAALTGLIAFLYRYAQQLGINLPGNRPTFPPTPPAGQGGGALLSILCAVTLGMVGLLLALLVAPTSIPAAVMSFVSFAVVGAAALYLLRQTPVAHPDSCHRGARFYSFDEHPNADMRETFRAIT